MKHFDIEPLEARIAPATLSINSFTVAEGNSGTTVAKFLVSLDAASTDTVTVAYATANGLATLADGDYQSAAATLTFAPGETLKEIDVLVNGDVRDENVENFFVNLSAATNAVIGTAQGTATITNDDTAPTLSITSPTITEISGGNSTATFTVNLSAASGKTVSVSYATADGTARVSDGDYTTASGALTFAPGETAKTFTVSVGGDTRNEENETFLVNLSSAVNATIPAGQGTGTATINNDDPLPTFAVSSPTITEGSAGSSKAVFTVSLSTASGRQTTVNFATADGTATSADGDYVPFAGILVFAPNETSKTVEVTVNGDLRDEDAETFSLTLSDPVNATLPGGGTLTGTGTITDDDAAPTITLAGTTVTEGNAGTTNAVFTVTLSAPSSRSITVAYETLDGSATVAGGDYAAQALQTLTFAPGETSKQVTVAVNGDLTPEAIETFSLRLSAATNATLAGGQATAQAAATINNDDARLIIGNATVVESASGTPTLVFTVSLEQPPAGLVTVNFATQDVTATSVGDAKDYTATSGTLTFDPNDPVVANRTSRTISVPILDDTIFEGTETLNVVLSNPQGAGLSAGQGPAVGTITDNEVAPTITIASTNANVLEGNSGTTNAVFTVTRTAGATQSPVSVTYLINNGTATLADGDFQGPVSGTLTFAADELTKTITVPIVGDGKGEADETFTVNLINPQNATLGNSAVTGTIRNDDATLSVGNVTIVEGDTGVKQAIFTVTLAGGPAAGAVTVDYATQDGAAISVGAQRDFEATSGTLTFAAGETVKRIAVPIYGDLRNEGDETFQLNFSNPSIPALLQTQAVGTITNDEPTLSIDSTTISEGNSGTKNAVFTITLGAPRTEAVTVLYDVLAGTATAGTDFTAATNQLVTFAPGTTKVTIEVPILGDAVTELTETFTVRLHDAVNARLGSSDGTGTITNDDAPPALSIGDLTISEGAPGLKVATFTVTLSGPSPNEVKVTASTANGTALAGSDFVQRTQELVFAAGETTKTFDVQIVGDSSGELGESFSVNLSGAQNASIADASAMGTITDDDAALSVADVRIVEGESGTRQAIFTVRLANGPASGNVTVEYQTADASATSSGSAVDFVRTAGSLTFAPGVTEQTVAVTINGDTTAELDETFTLNLGTPIGASIADGQATGTITTDEVGFSVGNATLLEGDSGTSSLIFTITRTGSTAGGATIAYQTIDGSAVSTGTGGDFTAQSGTVNFAAGQSALTISVPVVGDLAREAAEQFTLRLSGATGGVLTGADANGVLQVTGTIENNDAVPALSIGDVQITEGNAGTKLATFTVTLAAPSNEQITVNFLTADGTATAGSDYAATTGTLTFAPGVTSQTVQVVLTGDTADETSETFTVNLLDPTNATIADGSAIGTILNDDLILSASEAVLVEGNTGTANLVYTITLNQASSHDVTFSYATQDGTATVAGNDYTAASGTVTIVAGATSATINVPVKGDLQDEGDETLSLKLSNVIGAQLAAETIAGTIQNDDAASLSISDVTLSEPQSGTANASFTVTLSNPSTKTVTVSYLTGDGTATLVDGDYTQSAGTITFAPGETTKTVNVPVAFDTKIESTENFTVQLKDVFGATIADGTGQGTINDLRTVAVGNATISEDGGNLQFAVTLSRVSDTDTVVRYSTVDGTAKAPGDYTAAGGSAQIVIPAGQTTGTISIAVANDGTDEVDETFTVNLISATDAALATGAAVGTGTILDNDDAPTVSIEAGTVGEGTGTTNPNMPFTVRLSAASGKDVVVSYSTLDGTASSANGLDFTAAPANATLTIPAGQLTGTINVAVKADNIDEPNETFSVVIASPVNATLGTDTAAGTINDDDAAPTISIADVSAAENSGLARFTVTLSSPSSVPIEVSYSTANNGAVAGVDYGAASGTVTFAPGETTAFIDVALNGDTLAESDEQFFVNLSAAVNGVIGDGQAVGRILNDDASIRLEAFDAPGTTAISADENGAATVKYRVILEGATPGVTTTVRYRTVDGTDNVAGGIYGAESSGARPDFTARNGTISFTPDGAGNAEGIIEIPITADANFEQDEQFRVELFDGVNALVTAAASSGTVTIVNDDAAPTLTITSPSVIEGDSGTKQLAFKATLSAANERDANVTVKYATADGTAISTGDKRDFTALASTTLTFTPGELEKTFSVNIAGDTRDEEDQTFTVNLTELSAGATFAEGATQISGTGTITDNDAAPILRIENATLNEDGTGTQFKVKLVNAAGQTVESEKTITVKYETVNGTAQGGSDFTAATGEVTFATGETEQTITIALLDDTLAENPENFQVRLVADANSPVNATLGTALATGTITDNDAAQRPVISINNVSLVEGDSGRTNAVFTVALSGPTGQLVTVNYATADETATASGAFADYIAKSGMLTFDPSDPEVGRRMSQTITIEVIGDQFLELAETFKLALSGATNATLAEGANTGTGTIENGNDSAVGLTLADAQITEGNSGSKTLNFTVQLSGPAPSDVTFKLSTFNGTAVAGQDYTARTQTVTIAAGQSATTFGITVAGDTVWEATESFFVNLTEASTNVQVIDTDPLGNAQATARGYIFSDDINVISDRKIQWIDVDGDLVTLTVSKGSLVVNTNSLDTSLTNDDDLSLVAKGSFGGRELQLLNFANDGTEFQGVNVSIVATKQPGFVFASDGRVDVGSIFGTSFPENELEVAGIDFGTVTVDGDLAQITAGDVFASAAIRNLDVYSFGVRGTTTGASANAQGVVASKVIGPITNLTVEQNFQGAILEVIGDSFANIGTLKIGGALQGGAAQSSGLILVEGRIGTATLGSIVGGAGLNSGVLAAAPDAGGVIGNVKVLGDIVGGAGENSGKLWASKIGNVVATSVTGGGGEQSGMILSGSTLGTVTLAGSVQGGSGRDSGEIFASTSIGAIKIAGSIVGGSGEDSGSIVASTAPSLVLGGALVGGAGLRSGSVQITGKLGTTTIGENSAGQSIIGGSGASSGRLDVSGDLTSLTTEGDVVGGMGKGAGVILSGGTIAKLNLGGSLIGADAPAAGSGTGAIDISGYIQAIKLTNVVIGGNIEAGVTGVGTVANSGAIRAQQIDKLTVDGDLLGAADNPVIISGLGGLSATAIKSVLVKGKVEFAEILAGYNANATASNFRGDALNADASLGTITVNGTARGLNIVAGGMVGADGRFGTADDRLIAGTNAIDAAGIISQIASVVIKGGLLPTAGPTPGAYGFVAQHLVSVKLGAAGIPAPLLKGAGNDLASSDTDPDPGLELAPGSGFRGLELRLPA